jgi:hypothetical protein
VRALLVGGDLRLEVVDVLQRIADRITNCHPDARATSQLHPAGSAAS